MVEKVGEQGMKCVCVCVRVKKGHSGPEGEMVGCKALLEMQLLINNFRVGCVSLQPC